MVEVVLDILMEGKKFGVSLRSHMGDGGGGGWGGAPRLASKNLSPPLEPKIRDLQKKFWPEQGENQNV